MLWVAAAIVLKSRSEADGKHVSNMSKQSYEIKIPPHNTSVPPIKRGFASEFD